MTGEARPDAIAALLRTRLERLRVLDTDPNAVVESHEHCLCSDLDTIAILLREAAALSRNCKLMRATEAVFKYLDERRERVEAEMATEAKHAVREWQMQQDIRKHCIFHFYSEPKFTVDMSDYRARVAVARASSGDEVFLARLERYLDEKRILSEIYVSIRNEFTFKLVGQGLFRLPELEELRSAFEETMADVRRRANITVPDRIAKALLATPK